MRISCCGGGIDWRVIVGLPSALQEEVLRFENAYVLHQNTKEQAEEGVGNLDSMHEEVIETLARLQDTCPGLFAHRTEQDAHRVITMLDLLNGTGLPQRY